MNRCWVGVLIVSTCLASACQSNKRSRDPLANLLARPEVTRQMNYGPAWQTPLGLGKNQTVRHAELLGDRLAVLESGNILSVIRTSDGRVSWRQPVGSTKEHFTRPVRSDDRLVICSATRAYIFDILTGEMLDAIDLKFVSTTTPLIEGNLMIHGSATGIVFAQDLTLGTEEWKFQMSSGITNDPIRTGTWVLFTNDTGQIATFNPQTGAILWGKQAFGRIGAKPFSTDLLVYTPSEDQSLYAYARNSGDQAWRYYSPSPLMHPPVVMEDLVLQYVSGQGLVALNALTGEKVWTAQMTYARPIQSRNGLLYLHRSGAIVRLSPRDGQVVDEIPLPGVHQVIAESASGGNLYLVNYPSGKILKLLPQ